MKPPPAAAPSMCEVVCGGRGSGKTVPEPGSNEMDAQSTMTVADVGVGDGVSGDGDVVAACAGEAVALAQAPTPPQPVANNATKQQRQVAATSRENIPGLRHSGVM